MRTLTVSLLALCATGLNAQHWAVIDPTLKYNYSLGGTDTITSQVFTAQVDTLAPDSFVYRLNAIGRPCDTCTTALGGACDGCYLIAGRPQFLGAHILHGPSGDHIEHNGHYVWVQGAAPLGASWPYDDARTATVTQVVQDVWEGQPDSIKTIALSDGGTIRISRSFGLISFPDATGDQHLIGNQTLGIGHTIPGLFAMFAYQPGDILQYYHEDFSSDYVSEVNWNNTFRHKLTCVSRTEGNGTLQLVFNVIGHRREYATHFGNVTNDVDEDVAFTLTWDLPGTSSVLLPHGGLFSSYPDQFVQWDPNVQELTFIAHVAHHRVDNEGRYVMEAKRFEAASPFVYVDALEVAPEIYAANTAHYDASDPEELRYVEGLGLEHYRFDTYNWHSYYVEDTRLEGAVLGGDTIGHVDPDEVITSVAQNTASRSFVLGPNPAADQLLVKGNVPLGPWRVLDASGRTVATGNMGQANAATLDVSAWPAGMYLLTVMTGAGPGTQRFIVAR